MHAPIVHPSDARVRSHTRHDNSARCDAHSFALDPRPLDRVSLDDGGRASRVPTSPEPPYEEHDGCSRSSSGDSQHTRMGVLHWPAGAGGATEAAGAPALAHDPHEDIPIQHLRWAVAVVHATPALARLFPAESLQVRMCVCMYVGRVPSVECVCEIESSGVVTQRNRSVSISRSCHITEDPPRPAPLPPAAGRGGLRSAAGAEG